MKRKSPARKTTRTADRKEGISRRASRAERSASTPVRFVNLRSPSLVLAGILVGVLLAALGVILLRTNSLLAGVTAVCGSVAIFLFAAGRLGSVTFSREDFSQLTETWLPTALILLAVFCCAIAVYEVGQPRVPANIRAAAISWILSIAFLTTGVLWIGGWRPSPKALRLWIDVHERELLVILIIFTVGLAARLYDLEQYPIPWSGDEASVGIAGRLVLHSGMLDLFATGWAGQPIPSFYPTSLALAIFGNTILAGRVASAVVGALTIVTLYGVGRELFGRTVATLAAAFLAFFPYHLQFSRIGVTTIFDALNVTLALWLVVRATRRDRLPDYLLAGIATGLSLYSFVGSRLVLALAFASMLYIGLRTAGFFRNHARHLAVFAGSAFVAAAPMAYFFLQHRDIFMDRLGQVGILFNGWLVRQAATTGRSVASIMLDQFTRSTLVYIAQPARGIFFSSPQPYLTIVGSLFFLIGMGFAFQRLLRAPYAILLLWFWSVVILGGVLTLDPPPQTRLFMSSPAVALFVAIGISKILEILGYLKVPNTWKLATAVGLMLFLVVQNAVFYFGTLRITNYYQDINAEVAMEAGQELEGLGPEFTLVMMAEPRMVSAFPTIEFLAPSNPRMDLTSDQASTFDLAQHLPALLVATPENLAGLQALASRFPAGSWQTVGRIAGPGILYYAYVVPSPSAQTTP